MDKPCVCYYKNEFGIEYVYCNGSELSYSEHNHVSVYTILLLLSGELLLKKQSINYELKPSIYHIIKPYTTHSISLKGSSYSMISVCINKILVENNSTIDNLKMIIGKDLEYFANTNIINYEQSRLLFSGLEKLYTRDNKNYMEKNINLLANYIEDNPELEINIDKMSEKTNISKYHLIRQFKKEIGLTPHKFQIQNRVRKAQRILNGNYSIIEAALMAGFYDESHFIRHFKNIMRITPTNYKESYIRLQ
ncbi:AraC family transcriptional regulator [Clostridium sp.]|uniref:helix-turn-helix domain-containing protein n=1 Tax=Clostridium sp. TaxID=1506 RepID=UPI00260709D5|nr:AraC family transcriptional regulator [Clostridium sp.]